VRVSALRRAAKGFSANAVFRARPPFRTPRLFCGYTLNMEPDPRYVIRDEQELRGLYGPPLERSVRKQIDHLDDLCRAFIAASPLLIIGTQSAVASRADGDSPAADASPRGDAPGFVKVADDHTLLIPDRRGNNRTDTLSNILRNPAVGLLFFVPGVNETFRVNGDAVISRDPALTSQFVVQGKEPRTVIVVKVREAYIHCGRALLRADLWNPAKHAAPGAVPTMGMMMAKHTGGFVDAEAYDADVTRRLPTTLY
jgi:PPOX class probable FMN-dependent enzyme